MPEQPPAFVVVDKRKFTAEGERREGAAPEPQASPDTSASKVVTMPPRTPEATEDASRDADDLLDEGMAGELQATGATAFQPDEPGSNLPSEYDEFGAPEPVGEPRSEAEAAAQNAAYQQTSRELDSLLRESNPGAPQPGAVTFDHVIQSFYLSAIMAMGAGTEPGQKPRIDILGARQAIDMLGVLEEKTRGNLLPEEQQLLQGITFELRMMFLELTNAISRQAHQPPPGGSIR